MRTRHLVAGATSAASALALIVVAPASAHDAVGPAPLRYGPTVGTSTLLSALVSTPLDRLTAWATALQQKVAAVPDDTVLSGRARLMAKRQLRAAVESRARLATLTGLSAGQQAQVDALRAVLAAAITELKVLLANTPPATKPVTLVRTSLRTSTPLTLDSRHHCDGHRDGFGDRSWDGWGDGFHR
jgi:hypothetical protein